MERGRPLNEFPTLGLGILDFHQSAPLKEACPDLCCSCDCLPTLPSICKWRQSGTPFSNTALLFIFVMGLKLPHQSQAEDRVEHPRAHQFCSVPYALPLSSERLPGTARTVWSRHYVPCNDRSIRQHVNNNTFQD